MPDTTAKSLIKLCRIKEQIHIIYIFASYFTFGKIYWYQFMMKLIYSSFLNNSLKKYYKYKTTFIFIVRSREICRNKCTLGGTMITGVFCVKQNTKLFMTWNSYKILPWSDSMMNNNMFTKLVVTVCYFQISIAFFHHMYN